MLLRNPKPHIWRVGSLSQKSSGPTPLFSRWENRGTKSQTGSFWASNWVPGRPNLAHSCQGRYNQMSTVLFGLVWHFSLLPSQLHIQFHFLVKEVTCTMLRSWPQSSVTHLNYFTHPRKPGSASPLGSDSFVAYLFLRWILLEGIQTSLPPIPNNGKKFYY